MSDNMKKVCMILAAGASFGAAGALFYFLLKKEDTLLELEHRIIKTTKHSIEEVVIPRDIIGSFIGRQGSNIKGLQEETNTRIYFRDCDDEDSSTRTALIRGSLEDVTAAKEKVNDFIRNQPKIVNEEIHVPQKACGMLIGRNGENIRQMCRLSKAKITIESMSTSGNTDPNSLRLITIRGSPESIDMAKIMIHEKLIESEERYRRDQECNKKTIDNRSNNFDSSNIKHQLALTSPPNDDQGQPDEDRMQERLIPSGNDGFVETFTSAVANPSKFWLQAVGLRSTDLDKMVESMTEFYRNKGNREKNCVANELPNIKVGDIVAAPFTHDKSWYRVEVVDIMYDDYDPNLCILEIFYIDFGDSNILNAKEVCILKQEFMKLPFQAIECCLAGVKAKDDSDWSDDATDLFEELVHVGEWKIIMARPVGFTSREGRKVQFVELVDTNKMDDVNVGEELIGRNLAIRNVL